MLRIGTLWSIWRTSGAVLPRMQLILSRVRRLSCRWSLIIASTSKQLRMRWTKQPQNWTLFKRELPSDGFILVFNTCILRYFNTFYFTHCHLPLSVKLTDKPLKSFTICCGKLFVVFLSDPLRRAAPRRQSD